MSKTHYKRLMNPDYIGAYSLNEGEDLTVVIAHVAREVITGTGGKKEECTVAHLKGQKPMILNSTNQKSIAKLYGPYIEPDVPTAASNLAFDASLRARDPAWGLRDTDIVKAAATDAGFAFAERRAMPANNLMLLFRRT